MVGAGSGVILLGVVQNTINIADVSSDWIDVINGTVVPIASIIGGAEVVE